MILAVPPPLSVRSSRVMALVLEVERNAVRWLRSVVFFGPSSALGRTSGRRGDSGCLKSVLAPMRNVHVPEN